MKQPKRQKQQEKLEELIKDLERDLSEGKSQVVALEEAYKRLEESERLCQELADENRRLATEVTVWQGRCARNDESKLKVNALEERLETLQAEHAQVIASNRELERKLAAAKASVSPGVSTATVRWNLPIHAVRATQLVRSWFRENRRVATGLSGALFLFFVAALMFQRSESPRSDRLPMFPSEPVTAPERRPKPAAKPTTSATPRVRGIFQTIRPAIVYSQPSEDSDFIANIGKGTRVNVVNSQNGWLEIHSKHGRRPGFIRQEVAERVASNSPRDP